MNLGLGDTLQSIAISFNSELTPGGLDFHYTDEETSLERFSELCKVTLLISERRARV